VEIGTDCLIGPQASLVGCQLSEAVYVATQVMIFHGELFEVRVFITAMGRSRW
jgi:carbonic anhydrase/acetyltransferase-like protein (isoleucine patch superfamily)